MSTEDSIGLFSEIERSIEDTARKQVEADTLKFAHHLHGMLRDLGLSAGLDGTNKVIEAARQTFEKERFSYVLELRKQAAIKIITGSSELLSNDGQPPQTVNNT